MKKILLTGSTGFLGKAFLQSVIDHQDQYEVIGLKGDLLDFESVCKQVEEVNPSFIIHLAARTEVEKSFYDPSSFSSVNYVGTVNMIEASRLAKNLELFVFSSTMETYGYKPAEEWKPFTEETPQAPNAPYAVAKLGCEYYLKYAQRTYGTPFCILRQTNSYGRTDNDFFVVEQFITQMLKNSKDVYFGNREPRRNFLYVDDLIELYRVILKNVDLARNQVFVTGPDNVIRIEELADKIARMIGWNGTIHWGTKPKRNGEVYYLNSVPDKARFVLGWEPKVELEDGLQRTINHWKEKIHGTKGTN